MKLVLTSGRPKPADRTIPDDGHFLAKPYSPEGLAEEIRKALAGS